MIDFSWNPEFFFFIIAVAWTSMGFAIYFFLARNTALSHKIWSTHPHLDSQAKEVILQRLWGFIFLGLVPTIFIALWPGARLFNYGLNFSCISPLPWWIIPVIVFIIVVGYFTASKPGNLAVYPQIRSKKWTPGLLALSSAAWLAFLLGYEFLFRGLLLFASVAVMDVWAAIALNCALYAFAHLYKGPGETFGAIPVGILLCYLTLLTGNIWTAFFLHSVMALSNEWWSIRAHDHMQVVSQKLKVE